MRRRELRGLASQDGFSGLKTVRFGLKSLFPLDSRIHSARPGFIVGSRIKLHNQFQRSCRLHIDAGSCIQFERVDIHGCHVRVDAYFQRQIFQFLAAVCACLSSANLPQTALCFSKFG